MSRSPWKVAVLVYEDLSAFEFACVAELFGRPRPEYDPWYSLKVCASEKGPVRSPLGIQIIAPYSLSAIDHAGTVVVPGWRAPLTEVPESLVRKLQRAHADGARIVSVCTGAFVLAAAGLLDGGPVTTHWLYADRLAEAYPELDVDPDVLYTDHGSVITSAGSAAGIDACLHLIQRDCGAEVANAVARRLVVSPHREGGQQQFIRTLIARDGAEEAFGTLLDQVRRDLRSAFTVEGLARRAHMSPRTFARRFKDVTGSTPHRWLTGERVRLAQGLLETTDRPLGSIAQACGFGDAQVMRLHFRRWVGTSPSRYRRAFRERSLP